MFSWNFPRSLTDNLHYQRKSFKTLHQEIERPTASFIYLFIYFSWRELKQSDLSSIVLFVCCLFRIFWLAIMVQTMNVQAIPTVSIQQILLALLHESTFQNNFWLKTKHILFFISRLTSLLDNFMQVKELNNRVTKLFVILRWHFLIWIDDD